VVSPWYSTLMAGWPADAPPTEIGGDEVHVDMKGAWPVACCVGAAAISDRTSGHVASVVSVMPLSYLKYTMPIGGWASSMFGSAALSAAGLLALASKTVAVQEMFVPDPLLTARWLVL